MADQSQPIYSWRPTGSQQGSNYFGAKPSFGQALNNGVAAAGGAQSPFQAPAQGGGFNVPGGNSAGFDSPAFAASNDGAKTPAPQSFGDALRNNPLALQYPVSPTDAATQAAMHSAVGNLQPREQPSMSSMFALNEENKSEAESLRRAQESSALNGRAFTGQIAGDTADTLAQKIIPQRQNFLGQLQGQEQQQQIAQQQNAQGNILALAGQANQASQFQQGQAQQNAQFGQTLALNKQLGMGDLSIREKTLAQSASQFKDQLSFQKYATDQGFSQQESQRAWQATQNQAQIASTEKIAMADLSIREKTLAQSANQFTDQLSFQKYATDKGFSEQESQRAWQATQNQAQLGSTEKIAFAGLDQQKSALAQQAMQFNSSQDFQKWATQASLDAETSKLVWQATQNEKDRQLQAGQGDLNRTLQKYISDQGLALDSSKLAAQVSQFASNQDFQKWATQAGIDQENQKLMWQANQNDIQRKQDLGMQLTANDQQVRMEGLTAAHDASMAQLNQTLNLNTIDKQTQSQAMLKTMDQNFQSLMTDKNFSNEQALAATKQDYALALEKQGYDHQTALQASDQWFQGQQQQKQLDQTKMLSEAQMAQQYTFFSQDLQQKYNFKQADIAQAQAALGQQATQFAQSLGLDTQKFNLLKSSTQFQNLSDTTSTLMAMAGDNKDMLQFAAENFYKGLANMPNPSGAIDPATGQPATMMTKDQASQGILNIKAASFSDPAAFATWAAGQKDGSGQPTYTADQIKAAQSNTGTPGTFSAGAEAAGSVISKTAAGTAEAKTELTDYATKVSGAYANAPAGQMVDLGNGHGTIIGADMDAAARRLKAKGVPGSTIENYVAIDGGNNGFLGIGGAGKSYRGTPEFANYTVYTKLLGSMNPVDAQKALVNLIGVPKAVQALNLEGSQLDKTLLQSAIGNIGGSGSGTVKNGVANGQPDGSTFF